MDIAAINNDQQLANSLSTGTCQSTLCDGIGLFTPKVCH